MPAAIAALFEEDLSRLPSTEISPLSRRDMPNSVSANSVRPAPSRPMRPRISPSWMVKETSSNSPARLAPFTSSTRLLPDVGRADSVCSRLSPVISSDSRLSSISAAGKVPTLRPSRSTVTRSAISTTSSSRWLTKTMLTPCSLSRRTVASSRSTSRRVSDAVGSSMNRMRALAASPRQMATIWRCATGSLPTGASRGSWASSRASAAFAASRICFSRGRLERRRQLQADCDVLLDREVREQRQVLEDDLDAELPCLVWREVRMSHSAHLDLAARIWRVDARKDLDQRRLAGAVLADKAMHLAGRD